MARRYDADITVVYVEECGWDDYGCSYSVYASDPDARLTVDRGNYDSAREAYAYAQRLSRRYDAEVIQV